MDQLTAKFPERMIKYHNTVNKDHVAGTTTSHGVDLCKHHDLVL